MNAVTNFVSDNKIPVGEYSRRAVLWMQENMAFLLDPAANAAETVLKSTGAALLAAPPPITIAVIAAAAYGMHRTWKAPALAACALLFIWNQGYWRETMRTLSCVVWAAALCMAAGVPAGIWCARHPRAYRAWALPALDMMQTLPTFVYLIPMLALFGLGYAPGLVATAIFAMPAVVRMTYLGVTGVPRDLVEVGAAFGGHAAATAVAGADAARDAEHSGWADAVRDAVAFHGGYRGAGGDSGAGRSCCAGAEHRPARGGAGV